MSDTADMKGTGNVMKVIELGLQNEIYNEMKKDSFSAEGLTRKFRDKGINITAQSIRKFIKKTKAAQQAFIAKDIKASNELQKLTVDYTQKIKDILTEVEEVKNETKDDKDYKTYDKLVGRLYQGLELLGKLSGDIKQRGSIDINIIYNEINADVEKRMTNMKHEIFKDNVIDIDAEIIKEDKEIAKKMNDH